VPLVIRPRFRPASRMGNIVRPPAVDGQHLAGDEARLL
jgi:hypothetical protein